MDDFPDLSDLLDEGYAMRGEKRWPKYGGGYLDRSQYVSASEVGNCSRRTKFGKVYPRPAFSNWGYAERGHLIEAWAIDLIRSALLANYRDQWTLMFAGGAQFSFAHEFQSGTPDGLLVHNETQLGLCIDVKSVDPRTNFSKLPKAEHVKQVQQNMDLIERCTHYKVPQGVLFYIDASNLQRRRMEIFRKDDSVQGLLRIKAENIMCAGKPEDLPAEGLYMGDECSRCNFTDKCNAQVENDKATADQMKQMERAMRYVTGQR